MKTPSLLKKLNKHITKGRSGDPKPPSFYPSDASAHVNGQTYGSCRRAQFLNYLNNVVRYDKVAERKYEDWYSIWEVAQKVILPKSPKTNWIFKAGDRHEAHLIDEFKDAGLFDSEQIQIYIPDYNVSGRIDLIAKDPETNLLTIIEVKSCYGPAAESIMGSDWARKNKLPGKPKENNLMQISLYQHWYANKRGDEFTCGELIYGERGNGDTISFEVSVDVESTSIAYRQIEPYYSDWIFTPYSVTDILENYKWQQENLEKRLVPPRDFNLIYTDEQMLLYSEEAYDVVVDGSKEAISVSKFISSANGETGRKFTLKNKKGVEASLTKASAEQFVKYWDRKVNGGRSVQKPEEGSKKCSWCDYKRFCYDFESNPIEWKVGESVIAPIVIKEAGEPVLIEDLETLGLNQEFLE